MNRPIVPGSIPRKGAPLFGLALVLGCWTAIRIVTWRPLEQLAPLLRIRAAHAALTAARQPHLRQAGAAPPPPPRPVGRAARRARSDDARQGARSAPGHALAAAVPPSAPPSAPVPASGEAAGAPQASAPPPDLRVAAGPVRSSPRWSADGWLLWRPDAGSSAPFGQPVYGASQAGFVLRYRIASGGVRPQAYLRATAALGAPPGGGPGGERGAAFGLSIRPEPSFPLRLLAEVRADHFAGGATHARAGLIGVTEIPPVRLGPATRAEIYGQGGVVLGPAGTGFADGQVRVVRHLAGLGPGVELAAGAAVSAGIQRDTARVDFGPGATVSLGAGAVAARLSLDWRFRLAGNAAPGSGPALTMAAGF